MATLSLDAEASEFRVRTRAEGIFSRLAHDLELRAEPTRADVSLAGEGWSASLRFPVIAIGVAGVIRGERVDPSVLSAKDRQEIERRLRCEILGAEEVVVEASGGDRTAGTAVIRIGEAEQRTSLSLRVAERSDRLFVEGRAFVSLRALSIPEIKGPLGAFKVSDAVELVVRARLSAGAMP